MRSESGDGIGIVTSAADRRPQIHFICLPPPWHGTCLEAMKRRQAMSLLAAAGFPTGIGCSTEIASKSARNTVGERFTLGCLFRVIIDEDSPQARQAAGEAFTIAERINDACSPQMADAQVQSFCRKPHGKAHEVGPWFFEALELTRRLAELTDGRFDPTLGALTALWIKARQRGKLPEPDELAKAREATGWRHLILDATKRTAMLEKEGMRLDFGAVARGFAVDKMLAALAEKGFPQAIVRAGRDLRVGDPPTGGETWTLRVPVSDSGGEKDIVIPIAKAGISTAGGMSQSVRIGGSRYADMLDPVTGIGLAHFISATVIADSATTASALAVAACAAGPEVTRQSFSAWGARAVRMACGTQGEREIVVMGDFPPS
jgi:thiamine biosynthesis lipoprotein